MTAKIKPPPKQHPMYRILDTPPRSTYEKAVETAFTLAIYPDAMQQVCSQWFPAHGRHVADAFMAWRSKNAPVLDDLKQRETAIWEDIAGEDKAYVVMVYPHLRKRIVGFVMNEFDAKPAAEFEKMCIDYPKTMKSRDWNLERKFARELAVIRAQPVPAVSATPAAPPAAAR